MRVSLNEPSELRHQVVEAFRLSRLVAPPGVKWGAHRADAREGHLRSEFVSELIERAAKRQEGGLGSRSVLRAGAESSRRTGEIAQLLARTALEKPSEIPLPRLASLRSKALEIPEDIFSAPLQETHVREAQAGLVESRSHHKGPLVVAFGLDEARARQRSAVPSSFGSVAPESS
jgi:hypothetical protein